MITHKIKVTIQKSMYIEVPYSSKTLTPGDAIDHIQQRYDEGDLDLDHIPEECTVESEGYYIGCTTCGSRIEAQHKPIFCLQCRERLEL